jgi:hypothetical protein
VTALVGAELLKVRTTRVLLWVALPIPAFLILSIGPQISTSAFEADLISTQRSILEPAGIAIVFAVVLGIVTTSGEYAHGTITHSFLVAPRRERVVAAKVMVGALFGVLLALLAEALTLAIAVPWLAAKGVDLHLGERDLYMVFVAAAIGSAIGGALGVGLGGLLRRQTPAIVLTLTWLLIGENALAAIGDRARFTPARAFAALVAAQGPHDGLLGMWTGCALAVGYAAAFAVAGAVAIIRRDVG